jgi:hypothetical protein
MFKQKNIFFAFIVILSIICINFFDAKVLSVNSVKYVRMGFIGLAVAISLPYFFIKNGGLTFYIQVICISVVFSIYMAHASWEQDYLSCLKCTLPLMVWFVYFLLLKVDFKIESVEKVILLYGTMFMICFFYQFTHKSIVIFGFKDEFRVDRGIERIIFSGFGFLNLLIFMALNKLSNDNKFRFFWFVILIIGLTITVMQVTRQAIAAVFIVCVYHIVRDQSFERKIIVVIVAASSLIIVLNSNIKIVNKLLNQSEQNNTVTGNIRVKAAAYYFANYSPSFINQILGNGVPYNNSTVYGLYRSKLEHKGFFDTDIGLVSFYIFFGIFALIAIVFLYFKSLFFDIPKDYMYLKYYVFYLIASALTSDSSFNYDCLITNVFVFYCLQSLYLKKRGIKEIRLQFTLS